jgi:protein ImuA
MRVPNVLDDLRARIAAIKGICARHGVLPFGVDAIDRHLPGGGIACGALHKVAGSTDLADDASATIFLAGMLARLEGPVIWCLAWRDLFAPALHLAGLHPDRVIHVEAGSDTQVLLAMEESLRHPGIAGVVGKSENIRPQPLTPATCRRRLRHHGLCFPSHFQARTERREHRGSDPLAY